MPEHLFQKSEEFNLLEEIAYKRIETYADNYNHFKIGKTSLELKHRLEQYKKDSHELDYEDIFEIVSSKSRKIINELELSLIQDFIEHPNCENKEEDETAALMEGAEVFKIYVVVKK